MINPFQIPNMRWSLPSGGAVPWRRFVSVNSAGNAILANANTPVVGVSQNECTTGPHVGQVQEIIDGIVMVECGAAITAGQAVMSNADGRAVPHAGNVPIVGIAIISLGTIFAKKAIVSPSKQNNQLKK